MDIYIVYTYKWEIQKKTIKTDIIQLKLPKATQSLWKLLSMYIYIYIHFCELYPLGTSSDSRAKIFKFNLMVERTLVFLKGLQRFKCHI